MSAGRWGVWCVVSGGVTGHREAWLKKDGTRWEGTEEEAVAWAKKMRGCMEDGSYSTARYRYTARELWTTATDP